MSIGEALGRHFGLVKPYRFERTLSLMGAIILGFLLAAAASALLLRDDSPGGASRGLFWGTPRCWYFLYMTSLVVLGAAGGVGLAAVELGAVLGARVIAAASSPEKLAACRAQGASECIDYVHEPLKDRLKALTGVRGVDVVLDPVGGPLAEQALRATGWRGRFVSVGFASGV